MEKIKKFLTTLFLLLCAAILFACSSSEPPRPPQDPPPPPSDGPHVCTTFSEWQVAEEPRPGIEGTMERQCLECGDRYAETISAKPAYFTYAVEDGENVLTISFDEDGTYNHITKIKRSYTVVGDEVDDSEVDVLRFGENVTGLEYFDGFPNIHTIKFSSDIKTVGSLAIYLSGDCVTEIYFEGDAPTVAPDAFNRNQSVYSANTPLWIYPSEDSNGFEGMVFGGQFIAYPHQSTEVPQTSIAEYAKKTAQKSVSLTKELVNLYKSKNQEDLMSIPYSILNVNEFIEIKEFTLALTQNCQTEQEKIDTIFRYIVQNVQYTYTQKALNHTPYEVFKTNKAVCAGFTSLMHDMLCAVDIPSFYASGMDVSSASTETVESLVKGTYKASTHGWLALPRPNGSVLFYDPTNGRANMTAEQVGEYLITFDVDFITVIIDEFNYRMFEQAAILYENDIYSLRGATSTAHNIGFVRAIARYSGEKNDNNENVNGKEQIVGSLFNNGVIWDGMGFYFYASANASLYDVNILNSYFNIQNNEYGKELTINQDEIFIEDNDVFYRVLDGKLTAISYGGFANELTIPASVNGIEVNKIESGFLSGNDTVKRVTFSEGIELCHYRAIWKNDVIEYIYLPSTIKIVSFDGKNVFNAIFEDCKNIKRIEVSEQNVTLKSTDGDLYTKDGKTLLRYAPNKNATSFVVPTEVEKISSTAFQFAKIKSVTIKEGLTIGYAAFSYSHLESVVVPANCVLEDAVFSYCTRLKEATVGDSVTLGTSTFKDCYNLVSVNLPSSLRVIRNDTFLSCDNLYNITIPEGVRTIERSAFAFSGLTSITLPSTLVTIENDAFYSCYGLFHINNLSQINLQKGSNDNGEIALYAITITSTIDNSRVIEKDGFVFYDGDEVNYLTNILVEEKDLVLPSDINGESYALVKWAYLSNNEIIWVSGCAKPYRTEFYSLYKNTQSITIPNFIKKIPINCFSNWASLKTVYYDGTEQEWESVIIELNRDSDGFIKSNIEFYESTIVCLK